MQRKLVPLPCDRVDPGFGLWFISGGGLSVNSLCFVSFFAPFYIVLLFLPFFLFFGFFFLARLYVQCSKTALIF
jgi:hypothetical protein